MAIIIGKADKGGSLKRQADLLNQATKDLDAKAEGQKIIALAISEDEKAIYVLGSTEPGEKTGTKKGGK